MRQAPIISDKAVPKRTAGKSRQKYRGIQHMRKEDIVKILNCLGYDYIALMSKSKKELLKMAEEHLDAGISDGFQEVSDE